MRFLSRAAGAALFVLAAIAGVPAAELDVRLWTEPESLDFQKAGPEFQDAIAADLFEGLVTDAADGSVIPGQARSWTVSPDGLTYSFALRDGIEWSDGTPVVAGDFVYAMRRMVDPATGAGAAFLLAPIRNAEAIMAGEIADPAQLGVAAPDDRTLVIELAAPMPAFLEALVLFPAYPLPAHAMDHVDFADPASVVSNGPYKLAGWSKGADLTLVRNDSYYGAAQMAVDKVTYHFVADDAAAAEGFKAGTYDIVTRFDAATAPALKSELGDAVRVTPWGGVQWMALKLDHAPLDNVAVRRAMSMAIDRDRLGAATGTQQIGAWGFVPPGTPGFESNPYAPDWAALPYAQRLEQAKSLMAAAGYSAANPLHLVIRHSMRPDRVALSQAVAAMWEPIGIEATLLGAEIETQQKAMFAGDFEVGASHWIADYSDGSDTLKLLTTGMPVNYGGYSNPGYDALLAQAAGEQDAARRAGLLHEAEALAMGDVPVIPLYWMISANLVSPEISGFVDNVRDVHRTRWLSK